MLFGQNDHTRERNPGGHRLSQRLDTRPIKEGTMLAPKRSNSAACPDKSPVQGVAGPCNRPV
jgi:hypothetical protein